jgi:hypothetical protein
MINNCTRRGVPRKTSRYPIQKYEMILFPYTLPRANSKPRAKPTDIAKNVRRRVTGTPSRSFGNDCKRN